MSKTKAQLSRCICSRQFSFKTEIKHLFNSKRFKISKSWHALAPHLKKSNHVLFADPLGRSVSSYKNIYQRLAKSNLQFHQLLEHQPIQCQNSELCGLFCIFIAQIKFDNRKFVNCSDFQLLRFALHMML